MKILFIGPYRQSDGWGGAAKDYIRSLKLTGNDIVARPIFIGRYAKTDNIANDILEVEDSYFDTQPDVIIQNVLPYLCEYQHGSKNILLSYVETGNIRHTGWDIRSNLMDEVWMATHAEKNIMLDSGVTVPIRIVPTPFNTQYLLQDVEPLDIPNLRDRYVFYFIGEYTTRKNLFALVKAFHREFHTTEPVALLIKTNKSGVQHQQLDDTLQKDLNSIKTTLSLYRTHEGYMAETSITRQLSYQQMNQLHKLGDCLVMPSRGESMCRPVLDALYMGNQTIVTDNTGMVETVGEFGTKVESRKVPVYSMDHPLPFLYTGYETWYDVDEFALQKAMRQAYVNRTVDPKQSQTIKQRFSHQAVASIMGDVL